MLGLGKLNAADAKPPIIRYERDEPGELILINIKRGGIEAAGQHRNRSVMTLNVDTSWE